MAKRDRLPDAMQQQRKAEKRQARQKRQQRRLQQKAEMLQDAVSLDALKEQRKVLQQLGGGKNGKQQGSGKHQGGKGEKPRGGLDPLQAKQLEEVEEKIRILEAEDVAALSGDDSSSAGADSADDAPAGRNDSSSDDEDAAGDRRHGAKHRAEGGSGTAVNDTVDVEADDAWGAFFAEAEDAAPMLAANSQQAPSNSASALYGVALSSAAQAKPQAAAAAATTGAVSMAKGGGATSFVPSAVLRRRKEQQKSGVAAVPTVVASAATGYRAPDPLAHLKKSEEAALPGAEEDDLDDFLADVDDAVAMVTGGDEDP
jgi:hypothetical protein